MSGARYLQATIAEARRVPIDPRPYMTRDGYTRRSGAPTSVMVRIEGETRFRRVYCWQFSNAGTAFVRVRGEALIVRDSEIPDVRDAQPEASRVAVIERDPDDDPFFVCTACGLRSFLSEAEALALESSNPGKALACAHCSAEHGTIEE